MAILTALFLIYLAGLLLFTLTTIVIYIPVLLFANSGREVKNIFYLWLNDFLRYLPAAMLWPFNMVSAVYSYSKEAFWVKGLVLLVFFIIFWAGILLSLLFGWKYLALPGMAVIALTGLMAYQVYEDSLEKNE